MIPTSVDSVLEELTSLKKDLRLTAKMKDQIQSLRMELGFLKMFLYCLPRNSLRKSYIRATVGKGKLGLHRTGVHALNSGKFEDWDLVTSKLLQKIDRCKPKMEENCLHFLNCSFDFKFSSRYVLFQHINSTYLNLKDLVRLRADRIVAVKKQIRALIEKLSMFRDLVNSSAEQCFLMNHIQVWAYKTVRLSLSYWLGPIDQGTGSSRNDILSDLLQTVNFYTPQVIGMYLAILKASNLPSIHRSQMSEIVEGFVDILLRVECMKILCERLIFLIAFLMDPPEPKRSAEDTNPILTKAHAIACEIPILICSLTDGELKGDNPKENNVLLRDFKEKIDTLMAEVRKCYIPIPRSNFPTTNVLGFIDLLLKNLTNLKDMIKCKVNFFPFRNHQIVILHEELVLLKPFLKNIQEKQNEFKEVKDLWMRIINVAYHAEYVIDSCQIPDVPIWYDAICFLHVIEEIKFIKTQIQDIRDEQAYSIEFNNVQMDSSSIRLAQADPSRFNEVFVGFKDERKEIIHRLIRGSDKLGIVSIVGMPGQGKTTLAKKVYNDPLILNHFHKSAWCVVTQVYKARELLIDILRDVIVLDDEIKNKSEEELAHKLKQCLSGQRYLIVLDDIWEKIAWDELKSSFPDNQEGSRILLTSRNEIVALQKEFGCKPHLLHPLSEKESMELLSQKLCAGDSFFSKLSPEVKPILKMCNGLPLAIVVIAGMLEGVSNDLDQCRHILRNINSQLASEKCMDVLEMSYKSLPENLKPCFLYLAIVVEGKVLKVRKLIDLWIAEGFAQQTGIKRLKDVGMEYLVDLTSRSLVIVTKRGSNGQIKECRIHDLVRELCLAKAKEEKFMDFQGNRSRYTHAYRKCITERLSTFIKSSPATTSLRTLFCFSGVYISFSDYLLSLFSRLKFLRVLDFENVRLTSLFIDKIASLIFLRYLAVKCAELELPPSIGSLYNLETLRVARTREIIFGFPHTIWRMKKLRNVDIDGSVIISLHDYEIEDSTELSNLDSFSSLYLNHLEVAEKVLRRLPTISKLRLVFSMFWRSKWNHDMLNVLNSLKMIESVSMSYIKHLDMVDSCRLNFPSTLKKLTLSKSRFRWSEASVIGKLPNLEILKLLTNAFSGVQWDVEDDEFLNLKFMKLCNLDFSKWNAYSDSFPQLEQLIVEDCKFLEELPSNFQEIVTLKKIDICGCSAQVAESARGILSEQQEIANVELEVLITGNKEKVKQMDDSYYRHMRKWGRFVRNYRLRPWDISGCRLYFRCISKPDERTKRIVCCKPIQQFKKTQVEYKRRVQNMHKYNCQSRQAILGPHFGEVLKRDD